MEKTSVSKELSSDEFILNSLSRYVRQNFSFALWRLPESSITYLAASQNPALIDEVNLEGLANGFLFAPFDPAKQKLHLPADEFYSFQSGRITFSKGFPADNSLGSYPDKGSGHYVHVNSAVTTTHDLSYQELVIKGRNEIKNGKFEKIVPSRRKEVMLHANFDVIETFNRLCDVYPAAMISMFSSPLTGTWMGATPELLVRQSRDQHFHTVALAGTQPMKQGVDVRSVTWTQKDIEEQALVERYIISCFKKIRLREYEEHGPKTVVAGNVLHLKTDFEVDMVATNFPQLSSTMLKLLHPTSAVCGMPLGESLQFLKSHEGYDREYYSGYLGPVNVQEESHLYVNLRCMKIVGNVALLYAGAGVMADSEPEKEWLETELKMNTLEGIISPTLRS